MENVATLKKVDNEISNLFSFVLQKEYNEFTTLSQMREDIKKDFSKELNLLTNEKTLAYAKKIKNYNFYQKSNYDIDKDENIYDLMNNLSNFRDELVNFIEINYNEDQTIQKLVRAVSPPSEAYDFVGLSKLKITPTGREYGLLFE